MRITPDWNEMHKVLRLTVIIFFFTFMSMLIFLSCVDQWAIGKSPEELAREMFEVDSLMRTIMLQIDSTQLDFEKFYIDAQRINNGH